MKKCQEQDVEYLKLRGNTITVVDDVENKTMIKAAAANHKLAQI